MYFPGTKPIQNQAIDDYTRTIMATVLSVVRKS